MASEGQYKAKLVELEGAKLKFKAARQQHAEYKSELSEREENYARLKERLRNADVEAEKRQAELQRLKALISAKR